MGTGGLVGAGRRAGYVRCLYRELEVEMGSGMTVVYPRWPVGESDVSEFSIIFCMDSIVAWIIALLRALFQKIEVWEE